MRRRARAALGILAMAAGVVLGLASCGGGEPVVTAAAAAGAVGASTPVASTAVDRPQIVATTSIVGDVVAQVGGDAIDLTVLLDAGQDPHGYQPTARTLGQLGEAQIIFVNGLDLEESLLDLLRESTGATIVPVSDGIESRELSGQTLDLGDPHTWMSPINVKVWVVNIRSALTSLDPGSAWAYQQNAAAYLLELDELDRYIRDAVGVIPQDRRNLVTDHRVFGYFADEYGFEQLGYVVTSSSTGAEATAKELADLVELIEARNVPAIFVGETASSRLVQLAESVAREAGVNVKVLPVLTGSLARAGEYGDTYLKFIRWNVEQIVAGLGDR